MQRPGWCGYNNQFCQHLVGEKVNSKTKSITCSEILFGGIQLDETVSSRAFHRSETGLVERSNIDRIAFELCGERSFVEQWWARWRYGRLEIDGRQ